MRVFLDTNVLVSAFATRGLCADVLRHILAEHELVLGEVVLRELKRVLKTKLKLPAATVEEIDQFLREYEIVPKPMSPAKVKINDADDLWVIASAVDGKVDLMVTGDKELLALGSKAPLSIIDPRDFWTIVRKSPPSK